MSEDKVRTKGPCWSVGTIYDPRELPGVSTTSTGSGRDVTKFMLDSFILHYPNIQISNISLQQKQIFISFLHKWNMTNLGQFVIF
jgi:hypothetical protein